MNKELSAQLRHYIEEGYEIATENGMTNVNATCLMLAMTKDMKSSVSSLLVKANIPVNNYRDKLYSRLRQLSSSMVHTLSPQMELNLEATRLLRLAQLEARQISADIVDGEHLLLAFLRDGRNFPARVLYDFGLDYSKLLELLERKDIIAGDLNFTDNQPDDLNESNNKKGVSGGSTSHTATKNNVGIDSETPIIDNYGIDLTKKAANDLLDIVVGREKEIERIASILARRKKNNPILIGAPGVGKSAVVEGLANLIVAKRVPPSLMGKRIVALDMASIVAGTQYRGQFEERLRKLIEELRAHKEIILFVDEIHTIIGAGAVPGSLDAANILKPALARGEVQCIGATTIDEYKKSIEKDGALERRFQKIQVEATTKEETLTILKSIKEKYESYHNVCYTEDALKACVEMTDKYVTNRAFPDKAIDALDEAGSMTHTFCNTVPEEITNLETQIALLRQKKNEAVKKQDYEVAAKLRDEAQQKTNELDELNAAWLSSQNQKKKTVDREDIANVVAVMSGVPAQRIATDEASRLKELKLKLQKQIIAQDVAIDKVVRAITRNRLGLKGNDRPIGTFLFVGPTGVGKTYLVKTLAELMFDSENSLIRIDMSEYGEKHTTSRLVGAPPGYVGYEEGGQLTEKVRRHPYSVVLLDEIEKAHPDVFNTLLQVMDEGRLTDGNGVTIDFRNTIIIMTSNSGTRQLKDFGTGIGFRDRKLIENEHVENIVRKALQKQFSPEFLNRLDDIVMFQPLQVKDAMTIINLELDKLIKRLSELNINLTISQEVKQFIVEKGFCVEYGARSLKRSIQTYIEDSVCDYMMDQKNDFNTSETTNISFEIKEGQLIPFASAQQKEDMPIEPTPESRTDQ